MPVCASSEWTDPTYPPRPWDQEHPATAGLPAGVSLVDNVGIASGRMVRSGGTLSRQMAPSNGERKAASSLVHNVKSCSGSPPSTPLAGSEGGDTYEVSRG